MDEREAFQAYIRTGEITPEIRAMGETGTAGDLVIPAFSDSVIRLMKDYDGFIADMEDLPTKTGASWKRPQVSSLVTSSAALTENTVQASYGGEASGTMTQITFAGPQSFGLTPTYVCRLAASLQLFQDSETDLVELLASAAGEALAREIASVGTTALYAAATTGQESSLTTLTAQNLAKLLALVDPAYYSVGGGCKFYMSAVDAATVFGSTAGILANSDGLHLFGFPVVITNAATNYVAATVGGPVFGNLGRFMTLRRAGGVEVQVLQERYIDWAQRAVSVYVRLDLQPRGEATSLAFSK